MNLDYQRNGNVYPDAEPLKGFYHHCDSCEEVYHTSESSSDHYELFCSKECEDEQGND